MVEATCLKERFYCSLQSNLGIGSASSRQYSTEALDGTVVFGKKTLCCYTLPTTYCEQLSFTTYSNVSKPKIENMFLSQRLAS